jgi:predicted dinucleotide-utilizing enzyme
MAMFSSTETARLDDSNPEFERVGAFARLAYSPVLITYSVAADSTGNPVAFTAPFAMRIVDIIVEAQANSAEATLAFTNGASAMCAAIACAADGAVTHMSAGADDTKLLLASGAVVSVDASAADVRGLITFIGYKV